MEQKIKNLLNKKTWEIKALEEISERIFSGSGVKEKNKWSGNYPAMKTGDLSSLKSISFNTCKTFIDPKLIDKNKTFSYGDILIIGQSGSKKIVGKSYLYLGTDICAAGGAVQVIKHNQNPKWLIHVMNSYYVRKQMLQVSGQKHVGGMPNRINISELKKIQIPFSIKQIQNLIADFLDKFTHLVGELKEEWKKELWMRRKQYEYYKEILLTGGIDRWDR